MRNRAAETGETLGAVAARAGRINNLDFLRFFFAALVIYSHSFPLCYGEKAGYSGAPATTEPLYYVTGGSLALGGTAVTAFFILSGYLITQSWLLKPDLAAL